MNEREDGGSYTSSSALPFRNPRLAIWCGSMPSPRGWSPRPSGCPRRPARPTPVRTRDCPLQYRRPAGCRTRVLLVEIVSEVAHCAGRERAKSEQARDAHCNSTEQHTERREGETEGDIITTANADDTGTLMWYRTKMCSAD